MKIMERIMSIKSNLKENKKVPVSLRMGLDEKKDIAEIGNGSISKGVTHILKFYKEMSKDSPGTLGIESQINELSELLVELKSYVEINPKMKKQYDTFEKQLIVLQNKYCKKKFSKVNGIIKTLEKNLAIKDCFEGR